MLNPGHRLDEFTTCLLTCLADCDSALELGCGTGDKLAVTPCRVRVGVDAFRPYLEIARERWGNRIELHLGDALEYMRSELRQFDAILLLDFLEHLEKAAASELLAICRRMAKRKIVLFIPLGECPQDTDSFSLGGEYWQTHRSTWSVSDLATEGFDVAQWPGYRQDRGMSAFAVWSRP
jgi:SAM-dependent methyltransferase